MSSTTPRSSFSALGLSLFASLIRGVPSCASLGRFSCKQQGICRAVLSTAGRPARTRSGGSPNKKSRPRRPLCLRSFASDGARHAAFMQTPDGVCAARKSNCGFSPTASGRDRQKRECQESCSDSAENNLARSPTACLLSSRPHRKTARPHPPHPARRARAGRAAASSPTTSSVENTSANRANSAFSDALCASSDTVALASETTSVR